MDIRLSDAYRQAGAWPGEIMLAFFDGSSWRSLTPASVSVTGAVGAWKTLSFRYDPSWTQVGKSFQVMVLFNGHLPGTSQGEVVYGAMGVYPLPLVTDTTTTPPNPPPTSGTTVTLDQPGQIQAPAGISWVADQNGGHVGLATTPPSSGGELFQVAIPWDTAWANRRYIEMDVMVENMTWVGGANLVAIQSESSRWWDDLGTVSLPSQGTWSRLRWPIDGSRYAPGYPVILKFFTQLNAPAAGKIHISRLSGETP
ncbi:MAG TPA: hypothetical protein PKY05_20110 [Fibrobacteria bacterium]|nr:hypothetical protein [Fibrobacteria bacterium]